MFESSAGTNKGDNMGNPFETYENKIGIKLSYLISDRNAEDDSFCLIKYRTLKDRLDSAVNPVQSLRRARRGVPALVEYSTLPAEWRKVIELKYGNPTESNGDNIAKQYRLCIEHEAALRAYRYGMDNEMRLTEDTIALYLTQCSVIEALLRVKDTRAGRINALGRIEAPNTWQALSRDVNAFKEVVHDLPTTPDSLRHKVRKYQKGGVLSLISKKYGKRNASSVVSKVQFNMIEELISRHQNLNNQQVANLYNEIGSRMNWKEISAKVVAGVRRKTNLETYAGRRGETNFMHSMSMQIKRQKPSLPMLYWTADGWDVELMYRKRDSKGRMTSHNRLNAVMIIDPYNNYPIGYAIGDRESPALIKEAYRNAFNHVKELFGERYQPYQLQTDNYQIKNLQDTYNAVAKHFTPAKVRNSKAKVIEPYFRRFNRKHFQEGLAINWSGHNINSKKENQPNSDYLNKVQKQFPNEQECRQQVIDAIEAERQELQAAYVEAFNRELPEEAKVAIAKESFLYRFGATTGYTNRLMGQGVTPTIKGVQLAYDSFDMNFRRHSNEDWLIYYDTEDLNEVLAVNAKSNNGKLKEEIGNLRYMLELKYVQPMALYDRKDGDAIQLERVRTHNKEIKEYVIERGAERRESVQELFNNNPQLETLGKHLITTNGQHKDMKSEARLEELTETAPPTEFSGLDDDFEIVDEFRKY